MPVPTTLFCQNCSFRQTEALDDDAAASAARIHEIQQFHDMTCQRGVLQYSSPDQAPPIAAPAERAMGPIHSTRVLGH